MEMIFTIVAEAAAHYTEVEGTCYAGKFFEETACAY